MSLRILRINATGSFDTTTPLTTDYIPENNAQQPLLSVTQADVGRISFLKQLRVGSIGALVRVRSWGIATLSMSVRSPSSAEVAQEPTPDVPDPIGVNTVLKTIVVTNEWSEVLMVGPSDALSFTGLRGTIEIAIVDAGEPEMVNYWNAVASATTIAPTFNIIDISAAGAVPAWSGITYFIVDIVAGGLLTLPLAAVVDEFAQAYFINVAGSYVALVPNGAETLNGVASGTIDLAGFGGAYLARAGAGYVTTEHLIISRVTLTNAVAGDVEVLPALTTESLTVELDFTAYGDVELPSYATTPKNFKYLLYRTTGVSQIRLVGQAAERVNGVSNGVLYLNQVGAWIAQAGTNGWVITSAAGCSPMPITTTAVGNISIDPWGLEEILHRLTEAAGQILTLPALALVPIGAPLLVQASGAAKTVAGSGAETIVGRGTAAANTFAVANNTILKFVSIGTAWIVM